MNTNYFVLDANAFYNYMGRHELGLSGGLDYKQERFKKLLDKSVLFLSTSVLTEILVHFRNDLDAIRKIIMFINDKIENILITSTTCADIGTIISIVNAKDDQERNDILHGVLINKIKIEVYVVYVFAGVVAGIIGDLLIKQKIKESCSTLNPDDYSEKAMDEIIREREKNINDAESDLLDSYNINKEYVGMKKIYDKFLIRNLEKYERQLYKLSKTINPTLQISELDFCESLELSKKPATMYQTIASLISDFKKVKDYRKQIEERVFILAASWAKFDNNQKVYIASRLEYYLGNVKFKKNDVFDTLFLGALKEECIIEINKTLAKKKLQKCSKNNYHLLSFDTDVSNYIYVKDFKGALIIDRIRNKRLYKDEPPKFS